MCNLIVQFVYRIHTNCLQLYQSQWFVHFNNLFSFHSRLLNVNCILNVALRSALQIVIISVIVGSLTFNSLIVYVGVLRLHLLGGPVRHRGPIKDRFCALGVLQQCAAVVVALRPLAARHSIFYYFQLNTCCWYANQELITHIWFMKCNPRECTQEKKDIYNWFISIISVIDKVTGDSCEFMQSLCFDFDIYYCIQIASY